MTAIVGIRDGNKVVLASDGTSVAGNSKYPHDNEKVFRPYGSSHLLVAYTGTRSFLNAIAAEKGFFGDGKNLDFMRIVNVLVPKIFDFAIKENYTKKDADGYLMLIGGFLLATPMSLYHIDAYGVVNSIDGFCAYGFGGSLAFANLLASEHSSLSLEERAISAIQAAIRYVPGLGYPIYLGENDKNKILSFPDPRAVGNILNPRKREEAR
jgi:20S proteasome alpha/beta subunit